MIELARLKNFPFDPSVTSQVTTYLAVQHGGAQSANSGIYACRISNPRQKRCQLTERHAIVALTTAALYVNAEDLAKIYRYYF